MGNRILKDTIRTSKTVNTMTDFQFRLWVYLITYVDDYGRGSADPEILKGFVFPRRKGVTEASIEKALADLANSGSVILYEVDGEPYFCFPNWGDHQRIQTRKSKYPAPSVDDFLKSTESHGESRKVTVSHGESPPESNTNPNTNSNPKPNKAPAAASALDRAMADFADMRKKIKKPLTEKARELTLSELEKLAPGDEATKVAILEQSIQRCWQGVFPLKEPPAVKKGMQSSYTGHETNVEDDLDRLEQMLGGRKGENNDALQGI